MIHWDEFKQFSVEKQNMVVMEAFLRRISASRQPFMLTGRLLARQYLHEHDIQPIRELELYYLKRIYNRQQAEQTLLQSLIKVSELDLEDGIVFRSFRHQLLDQELDDAMIDSRLVTKIGYQLVTEGVVRYREVPINISLNGIMLVQPISIHYQSIVGDTFHIPYALPLSAQVAYRLYYLMINPRFKDVYDLRYLIAHPAFHDNLRSEALQILVDECEMDAFITKEQMRKIFVDDFSDLYPSLQHDFYLRQCAGHKKPKTFYMEFVKELRSVMNRVGLNEQAYQQLPNPSYRG